MALITSGRVNTSRSLLPRTSRPWSANRAPRKSSSVRRRRWIIVPMAPSRMRIRRVSNSVSLWLMALCFFLLLWFRDCRFGARCDEHRKWIAGFAGTDAHFDVAQAGGLQHPFQFSVVESQGAIAQLGAHPFLAMFTQIQNQHPSAWNGDPRRFFDGARRTGRVMQRL